MLAYDWSEEGDMEVVVEDIEKFGPSIIYIGWCFSSNGDVSKYISYLVYSNILQLLS